MTNEDNQPRDVSRVRQEIISNANVSMELKQRKKELDKREAKLRRAYAAVREFREQSHARQNNNTIIINNTPPPITRFASGMPPYLMLMIVFNFLMWAGIVSIMGAAAGGAGGAGAGIVVLLLMPFTILLIYIQWLVVYIYAKFFWFFTGCSWFFFTLLTCGVLTTILSGGALPVAP